MKTRPACFLILLLFGMNACAGGGLMSVIDYSAPDKAALLEASRGFDTWLRGHGFQPCAEPKSVRVAGMLPGIVYEGMTDSWYQGTYHGSAPFFIRLSVVPAPESKIIGYRYLDAPGMSESKYKALERHAEDFVREFTKYTESLSAKPGPAK